MREKRGSEGGRGGGKVFPSASAFRAGNKLLSFWFCIGVQDEDGAHFTRHQGLGLIPNYVTYIFMNLKQVRD